MVMVVGAIDVVLVIADGRGVIGDAVALVNGIHHQNCSLTRLLMPCSDDKVHITK